MKRAGGSRTYVSAKFYKAPPGTLRPFPAFFGAHQKQHHNRQHQHQQHNQHTHTHTHKPTHTNTNGSI
ncbi:hypothetical protein N9L68_09060 [bacterium]|nr:hypothetical protein [bacterium]